MYKILSSIFFITSFASNIIASEPTQEMLDAFISAGKYYHVNPEAPIGIARLESKFNPLAYNVNKDGSVDMGVMQINSSWIPTLQKFGLYNPKRLYEPTYNIFVGTWIFKQCLNRYGQSWQTIDCYNKGEKSAQKWSKYTERFAKEIEPAQRTYSNYIAGNNNKIEQNP